MRIAGSLLSLAGQQRQDQRPLFGQRLQAGANGTARTPTSTAPAVTPATTTSSPATSNQTTQAAAAPGSSTSTTAAGDSATISAQGKAASQDQQDQQDQVRSILARMFGVTQISSMDLKIDTGHQHGSTSSSNQTLSGDANGLTYDSQQSYSEYDQSTLEAHGTITLGDGREFHLDLAYQRTLLFTSNQSQSLSAGTAKNADTGTADNTANNSSPFDLLLGNSTSTSSRTQATWPALLWSSFGKQGANSASNDHAATSAAGSNSSWPSLLASLRVSGVATDASYRYSSNDGQHQVVAAGRAITLYLQASASLTAVAPQIDQVA
jgi:hypothetical protein